MDREVKVSVVMPLYNAERYVASGIRNILKQTISGLEIICVDDGSDDATLSILRGFSEKYPGQLRVFQCPHKGAYAARLYGVQQARGKYVGFFDCDDRIDPGMYLRLYKMLEESGSDMALCAFQRVERQGGKILSTEMTALGNAVYDVATDKSICLGVNAAVWNKLIRSEVAKSGICLKAPPRMLEDMMFLTSIYPNVHKIVTTDEVFYTYYVSSDSVLKSLKKEEIAGIQASMLEVRDFVLRRDSKEDTQYLLAGMAFIHFGISLVLSMTNGQWKETKKVQGEVADWLSCNFSGWKENPYFLLKKARQSNLAKPMLVMWMYKLGLFPLFLKAYVWLTGKIGIDIKW